MVSVAVSLSIRRGAGLCMNVLVRENYIEITFFDMAKLVF
jgi:hypothetical protein